jgi:two-component sensor histidine kinase
MGSPLASHPPVAGTRLREWVLDSYDELRLLRASLQEAITGQAPDGGAQLDEIPEKMALVATELATNALRHAAPPTVVRLLRAGDELVLDVTDHDPDAPPEVADDRPPGQGGLGLRFAQELSLDAGWYTHDGVKHVWATFPAPGSPAVS